MISISNLKIGSPIAGGYFAGIINTTKGNIQPNDAYQEGLRYALIVAPKSLESLTTLGWCTLTNGGGVEPSCLTRWNGLEATNSIPNSTSYPAFKHVKDLVAPSYPGASIWYLPAMDELELLYRHFKPNKAPNKEFNENRLNFPCHTFNNFVLTGRNISSDDPVNSPSNPYNDLSPSRTPLAIFQTKGAQAMNKPRYWSSTDGNVSIDSRWCSWNQTFFHSPDEGTQDAANKDNTTAIHVRPVRRILL